MVFLQSSVFSIMFVLFWNLLKTAVYYYIFIVCVKKPCFLFVSCLISLAKKYGVCKTRG
jgi:hypothetical protein